MHHYPRPQHLSEIAWTVLTGGMALKPPEYYRQVERKFAVSGFCPGCGDEIDARYPCPKCAEVR